MKYAMICVSFLFLLDTYTVENDRMQKYAEEAWQGISFADVAYEQVYGFKGKVIFEKREKDSTFQPLDYPEMPENIPEVKKVLDLTNLVIKKYNDNQLLDAPFLPLVEEWNLAKKTFKRKYDKSTFAIKLAYKSRENKNPSIIFFDTFALINYAIPKGKTLLLPGLRILLDEEGKVKYVACFYPPLNEDFVYILRRTESGWQFLSFSLENETAQPGPYLLWDKEGKIIEKSTRTLYFRDYDTPVDSSQILLRDSKPHEFWIPSESAKTSIGH